MNRDRTDKIEVNIYNGGMANFAEGDSFIYAVQNNNSKDSTNSTNSCVELQNNKKQEYIDNWNNRLFLHLDNEDNPKTLADAFIMPHFECHMKEKRIKISEKDTMNEVVEKFIMYNRSANMLITGVPGIGKTSIVSWIANEYKENDDIIILRFRDWERDELDRGLLKAIYNTLNCVKRDLENKIIILDGFDEMKALDNGENLIRIFLNDILDFRKIKVIITSRNDYIDDYIFQYIFNLLPFGTDEIKRFYNVITGNKLGNIINVNNIDVLGIPVILYMAIMSDINITMEATKPELYSKIFAEKGGIFDKFSYSGSGYDYGNQPLRDIQNIKIYLDFLQEIAFKMFDVDRLSLPREEDKIPKLTFQGTRISVLEFPIKNLFESTISNIEFVHKSIYEYFVSEFIIQKINNAINSNNFKEELAGSFGKILVNTNLSPEIIDFLKYKISNSNLIYTYNRAEEAFQLMLEDGMTYYAGICYKNVIACEMKIFANMLEIIHLWVNKSFKLNDKIVDYIKYNRKEELNLAGMSLSNSDLMRVELQKANLRGADLQKANLEGADLQKANLQKASLRGAYLRGANLREANLREADLTEANLREANLTEANLRGANLRIANLRVANLDKVYLKGADLRGANLIEASLIGADLRGAYLTGADLRGAHLNEANLREANLIGADLIGADLRGADLQKANLENIIFDEDQVRYLREIYDLKNTSITQLK